MIESEKIGAPVRTVRLLLVDDEPDVLTFYRTFLEDAGFEVTAVKSSREAAEIARRKGFDVAVIDERLPDVRGTALLRWLHRRWPKMNLVLFSAFADWEMYFRACGCGAFDVLSKASSAKELLRVLKCRFPQIGGAEVR